MPEPEAPGRLAIVLERILAGLDCIGVAAKEARSLVLKVAFDCVPVARRKLIDDLAHADCSRSLAELVAVTGCSKPSTRRHLEDLAAYGIVVRLEKGQGRRAEYVLSEWAREKLTAISRESEPAINAD